MNEWIHYVLPLPTEGGLLRSAYVWLSDAVFWGIFAAYAGSMFLSLVLSSFAEKESKPFYIKALNQINKVLFQISWAPLALLLVSGIAVALNRLALLNEQAMSTGLIGFGFGLAFLSIGFLLQTSSILSLTKGPTQSGIEQGLRFSPPSFLYSTYASAMALLGGSLFFAGAESWSLDESLWALGFFGSYSSLSTWFFWFLVLAFAVVAGVIFALSVDQSELESSEQSQLNSLLGKTLTYAGYTLPLVAISFVFSLSDHSLSLVVVVFSLLTLAGTYGLWHLGQFLSMGAKFPCVKSALFVGALLIAGLIGSNGSYGLRDSYLTAQKTQFQNDLKIRTYLDTAKIDSTLPPKAYVKSPYNQLQLHHF